MRACSRLLFFAAARADGPGHFDEFARHHDDGHCILFGADTARESKSARDEPEGSAFSN
jgi:hypothetical protein